MRPSRPEFLQMGPTPAPQPPYAPPPLVELQHVDVVRQGHTVLRDVTWRLDPGQCWGVLGANGSGKTSLLALIAGILWPAPGRGTRRYDFGTGPLTDAVRARREIALVGHELQDRYARWGWNFTALDVVLSGVFRTDVPRRGASAAERRDACALLARLKLEHLAERRFLELSRGEQRRLLIARALSQEPRILLLDEPSAGLDHASRQMLDAMIADIGTRTPIVCAAHSPEGLPPGLGRRLLVEDGRARETPATPKWRSRDAPPGRAELPQPAFMSAPPTAAPAQSTRAPRAGSEAGKPLIEARNADVWLGERRVLNALTWSLFAGEHWLVTGANGAGKSTFLRLLHGQLRPARGGSVRWPALGDPGSVWALRRRVAWVSPELQAAYRHPCSVRQCVASGFDSSLGLTRRLSSEEHRRVEALLETYQLSGLAGRSLASLSYGQLRRALIVRALVNRPRVLLLDEPWEGLDPETIDHMDAQLARIIAEGSQLVCASHLRDDASGHAAGSMRHFTHHLELPRLRITHRDGERCGRRES